MSLFHFPLDRAPSTPVERHHHRASSSRSLTPTSPLSPASASSSPGSSCGSSPGGTTRRRARGGRRHRRGGGGGARNAEQRPYHAPTHVSPPHDKPMGKNDMYFALDCEMVGVGPEGLDSAVARVTICGWTNEVLLDTFVQVPAPVTDYRTFVSGIEAKDLQGDGALALPEVQKRVKRLLSGKILVGHALENDLAALQIAHPWHDVRDTASYPPFMKRGEATHDPAAGGTAPPLRPRKLKELVRDRLGRDIQDLGRAHDPVEDARAALALYKAVRPDWERWAATRLASARRAEGPRRPEGGARASAPSPLPPAARPSSRDANARDGRRGRRALAPRPQQPPPAARGLYARTRSAPAAGGGSGASSALSPGGYGHYHPSPRPYLY